MNYPLTVEGWAERVLEHSDKPAAVAAANMALNDCRCGYHCYAINKVIGAVRIGIGNAEAFKAERILKWGELI